MYPYIIQGKNVTIVINGESHTVTESHINYKQVIDAIKEQNWESLPELVEPTTAVINYGKGNVQIRDSEVFWKNIPMHNSLTVRMIEMMQEGFPVDPLIAFMDNLMENPSQRAVNELYGFLENCSLPITPDGHFLAYKKVDGEFLDVHSGTVNNTPAHLMDLETRTSLPITTAKGVTVDLVNDQTVVSMPRNMVDDDRDNTCSAGLHFCSRSYLQSFGGSKILILKINPADVVSIPSDYNNAKGRTAKYTVVGLLGDDPNNGPDRVEDAPVRDYGFERDDSISDDLMDLDDSWDDIW